MGIEILFVLLLLGVRINDGAFSSKVFLEDIVLRLPSRHVVLQNPTPPRIPSLVQMNIVLAHNPILLISKRQKRSIIAIRNILQHPIRLVNNPIRQTTLLKKGGDHNLNVRKRLSNMRDQTLIKIRIILSQAVLLEVVASHVDVHQLQVWLVCFEIVEKTLIDAVLYVQNFIAANAEV